MGGNWPDVIAARCGVIHPTYPIALIILSCSQIDSWRFVEPFSDGRDQKEEVASRAAVEYAADALD